MSTLWSKLSGRLVPVVVVILAGVTSLTVGPRELVRADHQPITDLPFNGAEVATCGWHWICNAPIPPLDRANARGIDLMMQGGELVVAAGNAEVVFGGDSQRDPSYGREVILSHGGNIRSSYSHLETVFWTDPGVELCVGAPVGYVGGTGGPWPDHLHFEGHPVRFTPIWGVSMLNEAVFDFDPHQGDPLVPLNHDPSTSSLWTQHVVDNGSAEFTHQWTWQTSPGGYGDTMAGADFLFSPTAGLPNGGYGNQNIAVWDPVLENPNRSWLVYAFIPDQHATATYVDYEILVWGQAGIISAQVVHIDQSQSNNEFVLLNEGGTPIFVPQDHNISVLLYTWTIDSDCQNGCPTNLGPCGACPQLEVAADAMLFVDSGCMN